MKEEKSETKTISEKKEEYNSVPQSKSSENKFNKKIKNLISFNKRRFLLWNLGTLLTALGVYFFKFPNHFAMGGVSGISVLLEHFLPNISASNAALILNAVLLVLGYFVIGKGFSFATLYCTILLSALLNIFDFLFPMVAPFTDQPVLELFFAILLPGFGAALLFNNFASSGGTDIIAMILKKYTHLDIGNALFISDILITLSTFLIFNVQTGLMSILGLITKSFLVDSIIENINRNKYFTIITRNPDIIDDFIVKHLKRSGTLLQGKGIYSGEERSVVLCVVNRYQAVILRTAINQADPTAFVMISNTSQIVGKGFPQNQ